MMRPLVVVEFGNGAGTVVFEIVDLRKVGGVHQQQPGSCSYQGRRQDQHAEHDAADNLLSHDFDFW